MTNYLFLLTDSDPSYTVLCPTHAGGETSAHATDDPCDKCKPLHIEIPKYVDPAVLSPGAVVECVLDGTRTPLTVLRVEPALICAAPDGTELVVLAHTAVTRLPSVEESTA
jgi:hypothetical protein